MAAYFGEFVVLGAQAEAAARAKAEERLNREYQQEAMHATAQIEDAIENLIDLAQRPWLRPVLLRHLRIIESMVAELALAVGDPRLAEPEWLGRPEEGSHARA